MAAPTGEAPSLDTPQPHGRLRGRPWLTLVTIALGAMMVSLDSTVVAVAQPAMQASLNASLDQIQWVSAGYLIALAALLVVAGKLGDRFGHRRMFLLGTLGFTAASVAIGMSDGVTSVIALRVVQGIFGAIMQPPTLALLRATFPVDRLTLPIAIRSAVLGTATAAGPVVGGLLVQHGGWHSIFFVNLPIGLVTMVLAGLIVREVRLDATATSSDPIGVILLSAGLVALLWGVIEGPGHGWTQPWVWGPLVLAAILIPAFLGWERRAPEPLVPLSLFRSGRFSAGVLLMIVVSFVMFGVPFVLAFFLQRTLHLGALESGVRVLWLTLAMVISGSLAAIAMRYFGAAVLAVTGMSIVGVSLLGVAGTADPGGLGTALQAWLVLLGAGFGTVIVTTTHLIVGSAPLRYSGVAGGLQQTAMQIGGSLGTAAIGSLVVLRVAQVFSAETPPSGTSFDDAVRAIAVGSTDRFGEAGVSAFLSGMNLALLVAAGAAFAAAAAAAALMRSPKA